MPWLVKDEENPSKNLLFVHVPRCGGTSLTKHFGVEKKCRKGMDPYHKFGMIYFFYRYKLLETTNYPLLTWENLIFLIEYILAIVLILTVPVYKDPNSGCLPNFCPPGVAAYTFFGMGGFMFLTSTFVFTAPVVGRNAVMRRLYGVLVGRLMCNFVGNNKWLTGTSHLGFLVHFTASKMLKYNLVTVEDLDQADSFAIVRNPYSRMVSVYMYNRMGNLEGISCSSNWKEWDKIGFRRFTKDWIKNKMARYRKTGSVEEWDIYCHAVPMFEYTHIDGKQAVKCIVKQEELKSLWFPGLTQKSLRHEKRLGEIPEKVAKALQGMPHTNKRQRSAPWWDYYDQETLDMVYEAYAEDFEYFAYDIKLPNRPDLTTPKKKDFGHPLAPFSSNLNFTVYKDVDLKKLAKQPSSRLPRQSTNLETVPENPDSSSNNSSSKNERSAATLASEEDLSLLGKAESGEALPNEIDGVKVVAVAEEGVEESGVKMVNSDDNGTTRPRFETEDTILEEHDDNELKTMSNF